MIDKVEHFKELAEVSKLASEHPSVQIVYDHKAEVASAIGIIIDVLLKRAEVHDDSKLEEPEVSIFDKSFKKLSGTTYDSPEYREMMKEIKVATEHHYAKNNHHPEKYPAGIDGMTLVDLVEMFCDWYAATKKHADGNLEKSIQANKIRFHMSDQLAEIFENTRQSLQWQ